jgi:hypothetical protein
VPRLDDVPRAPRDCDAGVTEERVMDWRPAAREPCRLAGLSLLCPGSYMEGDARERERRKGTGIAVLLLAITVGSEVGGSTSTIGFFCEVLRAKRKALGGRMLCPGTYMEGDAREKA